MSAPLPPPRPEPTLNSRVSHITKPVCSDINTLPYYHPNLKNMDQIKLLLNKYSLQKGHFLLRNSLSKPGYYTISVMHETGIKHFNVERSGSVFYLKDLQFNSMDQLVQYYSHTDVPNKEQLHNVRLLFPINRTPEKSNFQEVMRPTTQFPSPRRTYLSMVDEPDENPDVYIHPNQQQQQACNPCLKRHATLPTIPRPSPSLNDPVGLPQQQTRRSASARSFPTSNRGGLVHQDNVDDNGYSVIPDSNESKLSRVVDDLKRTEIRADGIARCDCGLPEDKAVLPRGWSIHLSRDAETYGEVYFMSPSRETSWSLPLSVSLELTPEQQDFIRDCIFEFERNSHQTARAKQADLLQSGTLFPSGPPTTMAPPPPLVDDPYVKPSASQTCARLSTISSDGTTSNYTDMNGSLLRGSKNGTSM